MPTFSLSGFFLFTCLGNRAIFRWTFVCAPGLFRDQPRSIFLFTFLGTRIFVYFVIAAFFDIYLLLLVRQMERHLSDFVVAWTQHSRPAWFSFVVILQFNHLTGLVVKASALGAEDPGSNPACDGFFPGLSLTSDFKLGTPVATLPGAWHHRVSIGTG